MAAMRPIACALLALAVAMSGCDDDSDDPETTTTTAPAPRPKETFEEVPELPPGWKVHANRSGGFALGVPPGWDASNRDTATRVRSFDRLVAVSITPDRTAEGLAIGIEDFASQTVEALGGFEQELDPGPSRRFKHRYRASEARAAGKAKTGVREQVRVFVLRRDEIVTFTAVMAVNAKPSARPSERLAERMLRTLRSRPPGPPGSENRSEPGSGSGDRSEPANGQGAPDKRRR
jgi:hypothetical protein